MLKVTDEQLTSLRELGIDLTKILSGLQPKGAKKAPKRVRMADMTPAQRQAEWQRKYS